MKNVWVILKRDLGAYFTSPIGYIFIIVFLAMSVGLYITTFFAFPVADMRPYFGNFPWMLAVFVPAVTMRVWAEDRKENTWEMLLTFPMKSWELVMGKFLATLAFYAITLLGTITVPIMLAALGNPDNGAIFSGYLGSLLLGAFYLSIGLFISGFCKDQIVAFVLSMMACISLFIIGLPTIAGIVDNFFADTLLASVGSALSQLLGVTSHFDAFTRGVVEAADILYFLVWTVIFLALNVMYIDARNRPGAKTQFAAAVAMCAVIGLLFNYLVSGVSLARFDLTEDQSYTVSDASGRILRDLEDQVQLNVYITPRGEMPAELKSLEQDIVDKLEELRIASGGKLNVNTIYLRAANVLAQQQNPMAAATEEDEEETEEEAVESRMLDKGIQPFQVQTFEDDAVASKLIYAHIGIGYRDKTEEIIPRIVPQVLPELEYRVVSTVDKLTREEQPVIALVAPEETFNIDPQTRQMLMQMGQPIPETQDPYRVLEQLLTQEKYGVRRVAFDEDEPLPEEYDTLMIVNPRGFNERHRWELARALASGKSVVLAVQNATYDYRPTRDGLSVNAQEENPGVNELLEEYGITVKEDVLMDVNTVPLNISSGNQLADMLGMGQPVNLATHIMLTNTQMAEDVSITNRLSNVFYLWGSALELDQEQLDTHGLEAQVLMTTTDNAAVRPAEQIAMSLEDGSEQYPVMAMVKGQFPDVFADQERPDWPEPPAPPGQPPMPEEEDDAGDPPAPDLEPAPGELIVIGGAMMFRDDFLTMRQASHMDLALNSVDALSLTDEIIQVRGQRPINRIIDQPPEGTRAFWRGVNYFGATGLVAAAGIVSSITRRRSREAYTIEYQRKAKQG